VATGIVHMDLTRPLVSIDIEATGPDPCEDSIFEFAACVYLPDGSRKTWSQAFKPWKPISPGAQEVTGRKTEEFDNCPPFSDFAQRIHKGLLGKDLIGYNLRRFDLPILDEELRRSKLKLDVSDVRIIDAQAIFFKKEPRSLADAVRRYCKREHEGAHQATADAEATLDVLLGQLAEYDDLKALPLDDLAKYAINGDLAPIDIAGKLYRDGEGFACFSFGKNKDKRVVDESSYAEWMLSKGFFPGSTLDCIRMELEHYVWASAPAAPY
jgi:DNA polymerase III subunit epsilon